MHEVMNPGRQTSWTGINMVMVVGWCELSSLYSTGALVLYWWEGLKCSSILSVSRGLGTSRPVLPLRVHAACFCGMKYKSTTGV